ARHRSRVRAARPIEGRNPLSDTTDVTPAGATEAPSRRRGGTGLSAMLLPELQSLAGSLGITGAGRMRKSDLIAAIQERQAGSAGNSSPRVRGAVAAEEPREEVRAEVSAGTSTAPPRTEDTASSRTEEAGSGRATRPAGPPEPRARAADDGAVAAAPTVTATTQVDTGTAAASQPRTDTADRGASGEQGQPAAASQPPAEPAQRGQRGQQSQ